MFRSSKIAASAALCVFATLATPAMSAELGARAPRYEAPIYAPAFQDRWTGLYVGINAGYGWSQLQIEPAAPFGTTSPNGDGLSFGGQIGYNHRINKFVVGLETDASWTNIRGSATAQFCSIGTCGFDGFNTIATRMNWFGTTRARVGVLPFGDNLLLYATGGVAYGGLEFREMSNFGTFSFDGTTKRPGLGYAVGGGAEWAINRDWSIKAEYLHLDLGVDRQTSTFATNSTNYTADIVRAGVNYKF